MLKTIKALLHRRFRLGVFAGRRNFNLKSLTEIAHSIYKVAQDRIGPSQSRGKSVLRTSLKAKLEPI